MYTFIDAVAVVKSGSVRPKCGNSGWMAVERAYTIRKAHKTIKLAVLAQDSWITRAMDFPCYCRIFYVWTSSKYHNNMDNAWFGAIRLSPDRPCLMHCSQARSASTRPFIDAN